MSDSDIGSKIRRFLSEHGSVGNRLTQNELSEIAAWLQQELLFERQGWKGKLDGALQQIESHRKSALNWEVAFLNQQKQMETMAAALENTVQNDASDQLIAQSDHHVVDKVLFSLKESTSCSTQSDFELMTDAAMEQRDAVEKENQELTKQLQESNSHLILVQEKCESLRREKYKCLDLLKSTPSKSTSLTQVLQEHLQQCTSRQTLRQKDNVKDKSDEVERLTLEIQELRRVRIDLMKETLDLQEAIQCLEKNNQVNAIFSAVNYQKTMTENEKAETDLYRTLEDLKQELHERTTQINSLENNVIQLNTSIKEMEKKMTEKEEQISRYKKLIQNIKNRPIYGVLTKEKGPDFQQQQHNNLAETFELLGNTLQSKKSNPIIASSLTESSTVLKHGTGSAALAHLSSVSGSTFRKAEPNLTDILKGSNQSGIKRCLRCNKLYRKVDNNLIACRYHTRGKKKKEKLNSDGRIVDVYYIWSCCEESLNQEGCCTGQHV